MFERSAGLIRDLRAFAPADEREEKFVERMLTLAGGEHDPFSRGTYVPGHFTASSFVLSPDLSALLLIFHSKLQRWLQPGGHVDPADPDLVSAARREVVEEAGIAALERLGTGLVDVDIHLIPARGNAPAHEHFDLRYAFRARDQNFQAGSDALAARWVPLNEVRLVESDESVQRAVRKLVSFGP